MDEEEWPIPRDGGVVGVGCQFPYDTPIEHLTPSQLIGEKRRLDILMATAPLNAADHKIAWDRVLLFGNYIFSQLHELAAMKKAA